MIMLVELYIFGTYTKKWDKIEPVNWSVFMNYHLLVQHNNGWLK